MPSVPTKKSKPAVQSAFDDDRLDALFNEPESGVRTGKKKGRNAAAKQAYVPEEPPEEEVAREKSPSPSRPQSILGQTSRAFGRHNPGLLDDLDALGTSQKVSDQHPNRTDEWAQEVPYGKSPPGHAPALSVSGSPPVAPESLGRGGFSTRSPPVSPPQRLARPVSYGGSIPPLPARQNITEHPYRHTSSTFGSPPAPHLPQPHFYGANDVDLGLGRGALPLMASEPTFVAFSPAPSLEPASSRRVHTAILVGSEGHLDVLVDLASKIEPLGALHELPGTVIDAQFLTWESGPDPFLESRPLIVLTLHGPKFTDETDHSTPASDDDFAPSVVTAGGRPANVATRPEYQTRVEVYSLAKRRLISTLLKVPPVAMEPSFRGHAFQPPAPTGNLRLDVKGNFMTVSSGTSGEVYAFGVHAAKSGPGFECIGKFWTSIQLQSQRRDSSHGRSADADISPADLNCRITLTEAPVISLSNRWLAIASATSLSRPTLGASLGPKILANRFYRRDLNSAPSRPAITCEVDSPDADTLLSKAVREVAQGVARSARWFADQSMQTWNNYWKREQPPSLSPHTGYDPQFHSPRPTPQFPPTHSGEPQSNTRDPDLVSLFDLKAIQVSPAKQKADDLKPIATFQPPNGCSFLSFTPNGLGLITVSRKGDVQYVWDLMQIRHCRPAGVVADTAASEPTTSPRVRQLAKFARLTASTVIDVIWESAVADRFALVTKNGTVHVFDLPLSAFRWPPPRRMKRSRPTSAPIDSSSMATSEEPLPAGGLFAQAMSMAGKTQPIFANLRGRAPSLGTGIGGIGNSGIGLASATGVAGSRAVAAGLSKSLGAATGTVNHMRHAGESRLHLRSLTNDPAARRVAWDARGSKPVICVLDKAAVRSYYVRRSQPSRQQRASVFDGKKVAGSKIPDATTLMKKALSAQETPAQEEDQQQEHTVLGWCSSKLSNSPTPSPRSSHPLSHAEIDTNAPYQPFHSDARVNLFVYPEGLELSEPQFPTASAIFDPQLSSTLPRTSPSSEEWVFGNDIPGLQLKTHTPGEALYADSGSVIYRETTTSPTKDGAANEVAEQIVSTTRRRKKKPEASQMGLGQDVDQDGFFEDDCDVLDFAEDRV